MVYTGGDRVCRSDHRLGGSHAYNFGLTATEHTVVVFGGEARSVLRIALALVPFTNACSAAAAAVSICLSITTTDRAIIASTERARFNAGTCCVTSSTLPGCGFAPKTWVANHTCRPSALQTFPGGERRGHQKQDQDDCKLACPHEVQPNSATIFDAVELIIAEQL